MIQQQIFHDTMIENTIFNFEIIVEDTAYFVIIQIDKQWHFVFNYIYDVSHYLENKLKY